MELDPFNLMLGPSIQVRAAFKLEDDHPKKRESRAFIFPSKISCSFFKILVQSGARFPPCMRPVEAMPPNDRFVCLNTTMLVMDANWTTRKKTTSGGRGDKPLLPLGILDPIVDNAMLRNSSCSLQDICGMSDFSSTATPDQSFRFFTSLFVHSGVLHYLLNALLLWLFAADLEKVMNPIRFACGYL